MAMFATGLGNRTGNGPLTFNTGSSIFKASRAFRC